MEMTCPKCHGQMRQYERNGITVDQCTECRGIFLDRGELERLVDAENAWHGAQAQPDSNPVSPAPPVLTPAPVPPAAAGYAQPPAPPVYAQPPAPPGYQQPAYQQGYQQPQYHYQQQTHYRDHDSGEYPKYSQHGHNPYGHSQHKHKKKHSFLEELFD